MEFAISVVRSGGFAGLRKAWALHLDEGSDEADVWRSLIEDCPWDAEAPPAGPDRFVYRITVNDRTVTVPESALGPWRALTDRVREAAERTSE